MTEQEERPIPIVFCQEAALMRWIAKGRPWNGRDDVRLDGYQRGGPMRWYDGMHLPTGVCVRVVGGVPSPDTLVEFLREAVEYRADAVQAQMDVRRN